VPPAHEEHVEIEEEPEDDEKVEKSVEAHDAAAEIVEMGEHPERLEEPRHSLARDGRERLEKNAPQSAAPRMKAMVTFAVSCDATIPTAMSAAPVSQNPR
jgi:hypothetical protein